MNYNKEYIELLSDLGPITNQFGIIKEDENIAIKYKGDTIGFIMTAPHEYFEYSGNFIGFWDYKRFKGYFNIFDIANKDENLADTPVLNELLNDNEQVCALVIKSSKGKQQFTYRNAIESTINVQKFNGAKLPSVDAKFMLTTSQVEHIKKMIGLIKPEMIELSFEKDICKVLFSNLVTSDTYEIEYKLESLVTDEFKFNINVDGFKDIPVGEYAIDVCNRGFLKLHLNREDKINLDLFVSKKVQR